MFAVIHIPDFSLQAVLRHEPDLIGKSVALVRDDSPRSPVWQSTRTAKRLGVLEGVSSSQAKGRCEEIAFRIRSIPQEEIAQEILVESAYLSAAYVESTAPGICTLDLRGLPLLKATDFDDALARWADQLRTRLHGLHLEAHIGVAGAPGLALQAARGESAFRLIKDPEQFWRSLSVESVCDSVEILEVLAKWGIHTVSEFLALGKDRIAERLGADGVAVFEAAKADTIRPLRLTAPRKQFSEYFQFEQLVETLEPLLFIIRRLLEQLSRRVAQASLSILAIGMRLELESGEAHENQIKIAAATRDVNVLFRITHNYLETVRTGSPVTAVLLRAIPSETEAQQFQLFESSVRDPNRFYETIGRLSALFGNDRVGTPYVQDSYRPDDFVMRLPNASDDLRTKGPASLVPDAVRSSLKRGLALRRFRPPLRANVRLKDKVPIFLESTGPNGAIAKTQGPYRSSGSWWENFWSREEWDVQTKEGELYRIFLENNEWFVEGAYD